MNIWVGASNYIIPIFVAIVLFVALKEKINVFDVFVEGAKDGVIVVWKLVPTLVAVFFAIEMMNKSGFLNEITVFFSSFFKWLGFPPEIMPLALIRPISGSGAIAMATNIMKNYGVDSYLGNVSSVIMGATETTLYTIAVYTSGTNVRKSRALLVSAIMADIIGMTIAVKACRIM